MKIGTKSLLFGVHQFVWHPVTVVIAWRSLYKRWPTWRELVCIIVHDWGYIGSPNIDGAEGKNHPCAGARIAGMLFGPKYRDLVLYHSRSYAAAAGQEPSALCWADKLSIRYDPCWLYLLRANLSGELMEFRENARHIVPLTTSNNMWFSWMRSHYITLIVQNSGHFESAIYPIIQQMTKNILA